MKSSITISILVFLIYSPLLLGTHPTDMYITVYLVDTNEPIDWADPNDPYKYPEIMAGTDLTLVISSRIPKIDYGVSLYIGESFWEKGQLFGRGLNETTGRYDDSGLPAAGPNAFIYDRYVPILGEWAYGFDFIVMPPGAAVGDWFIVDFNTYEPGACILDFMDIHREDLVDPAFSLIFPLIPTRDYNMDNIVNFNDFSIMARQWSKDLDPHQSPNHDLDASGQIDFFDLQGFTQFWLARTRGPSSEVPDPNSGGSKIISVF